MGPAGWGRGRIRAIALVAGIVGIVAVGTAGCSSGGDEHSSSGAPAAQEKGDPAGDSGVPGGATRQAGNPLPDRQVETSQQSVVYTGTLDVRVDDVAAAANQAGALVTGAGGVIAGDTRQTSTSRSTADLVLRVPGPKFADTVNRLGKLGHEIRRELSTEDVTQAVADLDSRITSQKASVTRLRGLLSRAQNISDITTIETELANREAELESLQARSRVLEDQVALSTITLHLLTKGDFAAPVEERGFLAGLRAGWHGFLVTLSGGLTAFGAVLPFLVALAIPAGLIWWFARRRRSVVVAAPATAATPAQSGPPPAG